MSKSAHAQSTYRLRPLPKCSKCKVEMQLMLISYDKLPRPVWEWECRKCPKSVAQHKLKEERPTEFEQFLSTRAKNDKK
jgi:hypothetical protein